MKKYSILLIGTVFFSVSFDFRVNAQIHITYSDMPTVGSKSVMAVDTADKFPPQSASNVSQTWNFSKLIRSQNNIYINAAPSATSYYGAFPSSNLADSLVYAEGYTYYYSASNTYSEMGFAIRLYGYAAEITLHPFFQQIPLPATYGTSDSGMSKGDTTIAINYAPIDSGRGIGHVTYSDSVDAFGVMTTPYGTDSVIRQKHYDKIVDSVYIHTGGRWFLYEVLDSINYQYRWYAKGIPNYFAVMQMDTKDKKVVNIQWYDGLNTSVTNIEHSAFVNVYPNPCHSEITFSSSSMNPMQITIFDITGRRLSTLEVNNGMGVLSTSAYPAGMYFYRVSDTSGSMLDRGKFIVQ